MVGGIYLFLIDSGVWSWDLTFYRLGLGFFLDQIIQDGRSIFILSSIMFTLGGYSQQISALVRAK